MTCARRSSSTETATTLVIPPGISTFVDASISSLPSCENDSAADSFGDVREEEKFTLPHEIQEIGVVGSCEAHPALDGSSGEQVELNLVHGRLLQTKASPMIARDEQKATVSGPSDRVVYDTSTVLYFSLSGEDRTEEMEEAVRVVPSQTYRAGDASLESSGHAVDPGVTAKTPSSPITHDETQKSGRDGPTNSMTTASSTLSLPTHDQQPKGNSIAHAEEYARIGSPFEQYKDMVPIPPNNYAFDKPQWLCRDEETKRRVAASRMLPSHSSSIHQREPIWVAPEESLAESTVAEPSPSARSVAFVDADEGRHAGQEEKQDYDVCSNDIEATKLAFMAPQPLFVNTTVSQSHVQIESHTQESHSVRRIETTPGAVAVPGFRARMVRAYSNWFSTRISSRLVRMQSMDRPSMVRLPCSLRMSLPPLVTSFAARNNVRNTTSITATPVEEIMTVEATPVSQRSVHRRKNEDEVPGSTGQCLLSHRTVAAAAGLVVAMGIALIIVAVMLSRAIS